ncbi:MAG: glycosyltransferase family 4 protein [Anaerolineales bacterium]|nr:glycosyltransferase family 4 protein [Anaerolineales bacterium]
MKLLYITNQSFPAPKASTVQVMHMCAAFATLSIEVKLVSRAPETGQLSSTELQRRYDVPENFEIKQYQRPRGLRTSDRFQMRAFWRERDTTSICYTRGRDVTAPLLALMSGISACVEVHTPPASARERWFLRLVRAHPHGRLVILTQNLRMHYANELGFSAKHLIVAPDGVNPDRFCPDLPASDARKRLGMGDGPWVVYIGGLYQGRGLNTLFKAAAGSPHNTMVVGGRTQAEISQWQLRASAADAENVHFAGYQPPAKVPAYLAAADVLVMPYAEKVTTPSGENTAAWASPLKMFEYMAAARPIVATDLSMVRGVLKNEHNALLVPPGDANALRNALQRLAASPELGERLATNAHSDVAQHTWEARAQNILANVGVN